jgi:hypothetical protein
MMAMISLGAMSAGLLLGFAGLQAAAPPATTPPAPVQAATPPAGPVTSDRRMFFRPHTPTEAETLQRATSLAIGNLAWESVSLSDIQRTRAQVRWTATTRSNRYFCTADANGQNSFCARP